MADITRKEIERRVNRRESIKEIDMTGLDLNEFNFQGAIFYKCKFSGSSMNLSNFAFSRFEGCLLNDCEIHESHFQESSFFECDFSKSTMRDSIFKEINFRQSILHATDLSGSFLENIILIDAEGELCDFSFSTFSESD